MRYLIASAALVFALFAPSSRAAGPFDGIWTLVVQNTLIGYLIVQENNGTLIVAELQNDLSWNAFQGPRSGSNFTVSTIVGSISAQYSGTFTSSTTYQSTQVFCVPVTAPCGLPNGTVFTGTKIW